MPTHSVICSVILILITFSIAYCVQGLKTKNTNPLSVFLALAYRHGGVGTLSIRWAVGFNDAI